MSHPLYLLDTNVVLTLVRGNALGRYIDTRFGLTTQKRRPFISVVTHGEVLALAQRNDWGDAKLAALQSALDGFVTIDIYATEVFQAYASMDIYSQRHPDGSRNMGKNDLWIAACAKVVGATLLTTDQDFNHLSPTLLSVVFIDPAHGRA